MRSLDHMPQRFPFLEKPYIPPNKYHKMFVDKWYLILYQIKDDTDESYLKGNKEKNKYLLARLYDCSLKGIFNGILCVGG